MSKKSYISLTSSRAAVPRSKRLRAAAGGTSAGSSGGTLNVTVESKDLSSEVLALLHDHTNKTLLDKLSVDADGYLKNGDDKIKAAFADEAAHAVEADHSRLADDLSTTSPVWGKFLRKDIDDTAAGRVTINGGTVTPETVTPAFVSGWSGAGWRLLQGNGGSSLEVDEMTIRRTLRVFELLVQQVRSVGGELVVSAANGRVAEVNGSTITIENAADGVDSFGCMFAVGDIVRCQRWDNHRSTTHQWTATVASVSGNNIVIADLAGTAPPEVGDEVVQMGNVSDTTRQGLVTITATEGGEPRVTVLAGVNSPTITSDKVRLVAGGLSGVNDAVFGPLNGYGLYSDNAYLRGVFKLRNGRDVGTSLEIIESGLRSVVRGMMTDNIIVNGSMDAWNGWRARDVDRETGKVYTDGDAVMMSGEQLLLDKPLTGVSRPVTHYEVADGHKCLHTYAGSYIVGTIDKSVVLNALGYDSEQDIDAAEVEATWPMRLSLDYKKGSGASIAFSAGGGYHNISGGDAIGDGWYSKQIDISVEIAYEDQQTQHHELLDSVLFSVTGGEAYIANVKLFRPVESLIEQKADEITAGVSTSVADLQAQLGSASAIAAEGGKARLVALGGIVGALTGAGIKINQQQIVLSAANVLVNTGAYSGTLFTSRNIDGVEKSVISTDIVLSEQVFVTWPNGNKRITINRNGDGVMRYWYPGGQLMREEVISYDTAGNVNGYQTIFYNTDGSIRWKMDAFGNITKQTAIKWAQSYWVDCGNHEDADEGAWNQQGILQSDTTLWQKNGGTTTYYEDNTLAEDSPKTEGDEAGNEYTGWLADPVPGVWVEYDERDRRVETPYRRVVHMTDGIIDDDTNREITNE